MANEEQVKILRQGAEAWNKWREENLEVEVDLVGANLFGANLCEVDLRGADLREANFRKTNLIEAILNAANLDRADFREANLRKANLGSVNLREANFRETNLSGTNLIGADLRGATLNRTNLSEAYLVGVDLSGADLSEAKLNGTDLSGVFLGNTTFSFIDLSQTHGLESINHEASSAISTNTIQLSKGKIPDAFLRGCGLSDWEIESAKLYKPGLSNQEINNIIYKIFDLRANQAIQISPLFISYSHADTPFVEKLEPNLTKKGIRFWRDIHDMKSGRLEKQVDHAMRQNPTVILILSENSTCSDWVEHEARLARELEKELNRDVLCPIALDDSWKSAKWPARLMEQIMEYNILDYSNWHDDKSFGQVFNKMISGLDMFYKPESPK
jgi:uncharacterized protein YjbI with pentapeptide repeats